jgi:hypothetical protein
VVSAPTNLCPRHDLEAIRTSATQAAESFANLIETMDLQEGLMQTDLRLPNGVSTELNRFVRKVTAWGSIGIAWTVIVGL